MEKKKKREAAVAAEEPPPKKARPHKKSKKNDRSEEESTLDAELLARAVNARKRRWAERRSSSPCASSPSPFRS
eukprot:8670473-Pyramimonas_sp.AAC.1